MSRLFIIAALLGVTIGLPYVLDRLSSSAPKRHCAASASRISDISPRSRRWLLERCPVQLQSPGSLVSSNTVPLEGTQFHSVEQVLRFDITKEWVYQNWSRKSTGPTDVGLFAVRVPVVTGTHLAAIAGSLTYFFNSYGQVEHISFRGRTGDTGTLSELLDANVRISAVNCARGRTVVSSEARRANSKRAAHPLRIGCVD